MTKRLDVRRQFIMSCAEEVVIGTFLVVALLVYAPQWLPWVLLGFAAFFAVKVLLFPWNQPAVGAESMIGREAIVVEELDPEGMAKLDGVLWLARSEEGRIRAGEVVKIVDVSGSRLYVTRG